MRKVFLDELPKKQRGDTIIIDWKNAVGYKVNFIYDDIEGEIEIINWFKKNNKSYLEVKFKNFIQDIFVSSFSNCLLGTLVGKKFKNHLYKMNDIIKTKNGKIQILQQLKTPTKRKYKENTNYVHNIKGYKYKCLICKNIDYIRENDLTSGRGCNVCAGKKILHGFNDLKTIFPEIVKLLKYPERSSNYTRGDRDKEIFICPICKHEKLLAIYQVVNKGFSCSNCGDYISYPNKFGRSLFSQLNIEYTTEFSPVWIKPKRYDFYFELNNNKYIVEMDGGLGHGKYNPLSKQTAKESMVIDEYKNYKAKENDIEIIRINADISDMEYIKHSVINSKLSILFDLSKINWLQCHEFACNTFVKIVCDLWNSKIKNTKTIGEIVKLSSQTVSKYLKQGVKLGWCNYNPIKEREKSLSIGRQNKRKKIMQLTLSNEYIQEFESLSDAGILTKISIGNISSCCNNKKYYYHAGGYKWMYYEDYIAQQNSQEAVNT